jgi:hypothetical protein
MNKEDSMKRKTYWICIALILTLLLNISVLAESATPYASSFFVSYDATTVAVAFRTFNVYFDVVAKGGMTELGVSSIIIQQSSDQTNWSEVKTCLPASYPQMIEENTHAVCNYITCTGIPGFYYRAYVTFYAKNSTGVGEASQYSEVVWLTNQP